MSNAIMFPKPLSKLTWQDIEAVVSAQTPESQDVEYKGDLPSKDGKSKWSNSEYIIEDKARNSILEELIAFANATGGTMIIGIKESNTNPKRAAEINPLPKCKDLAERLKDRIGTGIEPKLQFFGIVGISKPGSDSGVVVIQVPKSVNGPHRHAHDKECYMRRGDKSEKITMHEIHNLVLSLSRSGDLVEEKFSEKRRLFEKSFAASQASEKKVGVRMTAIPLEPIDAGKVYQNPLFATLNQPIVEITNDGTRELNDVMFSKLFPRPTLRGKKYAVENEAGDYTKIEIYNEGIIDVSFVFTPWEEENNAELFLYFEWIVYQLVLCLATVDMFRHGAKRPTLSYALEIEIAAIDSGLSIRYGDGGHRSYVRSIGRPLTEKSNLLPKYPISDRPAFQEIVDLVCRDICDLTGLLSDPPLYTIAFSRLFDEIDKRQI